MKEVEDHPIEDMYGLEIWPGDVYWVFDNHIVHNQNLKEYLIGVQEVPCFKAVD